MIPSKEIIGAHRQIFDNSCITMSIELVLKLLGKLRVGDFPLQHEWGNRLDAGFAKFAGKYYYGIKFSQEFTEARGAQFPLAKLFRRIEEELSLGRYVIVSLSVGNDWHMYVVYDVDLSTQEFLAVTEVKGSSPVWIADVKERITRMGGTDIFTYE